MENVVLTIHLLLSLALVGVVLLQRSEGGGLGIGGGGGAMSGRSGVTALGKVTWLLAIAFICTSLALTILAARGISTGSVIDQFGGEAPVTREAPQVPSGTDLLPPPVGGEALTPPRAD
ncbi:MAG: preprotein translocase subunit SecG [Gemmobacter sp.]